jgi:hypothetical protein
MTRQELTAQLIALSGADERILRTKTENELQLLYYRTLVQKTIEENEQREEQEILQRAKDAAWRDTNIILANQKEEQKAAALLPQDKQVFDQLARKMEKFSTCEANFSLVRMHLGVGFREIELQDAVESGALLMVPPSQAELDQWHAEEIERLAPVIVDAQRNWTDNAYGRNQMLAKVRILPLDNLRERVQVIEQNRKLASLSTEDLKKVSRGERVEQRTQVVQQSHGHRPVPPDITAEVLKKADASRLRDLVRLYGSAALTEILKQR